MSDYQLLELFEYKTIVKVPSFLTKGLKNIELPCRTELAFGQRRYTFSIPSGINPEDLELFFDCLGETSQMETNYGGLVITIIGYN